MKKQLILFLAVCLPWMANADALKILEKPDIHAKVVETIQPGQPLIRIFESDHGQWLKVANPTNGQVGWVEAKAFEVTPEGLANSFSFMSQKTVTKMVDGKPKTVTVVEYSGPQKMDKKQIEGVMQGLEIRQAQMAENMQKTMNQIWSSTIQDMNQIYQFDQSLTSPVLIQPIVITNEPLDKKKK